MERTSPTRVGIGVPRLKYHHQSKRGEVVDKITTVGVDLAKQVFQLHGVDAGWGTCRTAAMRRERAVKPSRAYRAAWSAWKRAPVRITGRANCASSDTTCASWRPASCGRLQECHGQERRQRCRGDLHGGTPSQHALRDRENGRQQAWLSLHRIRQGFIEERTATINRLRGLLAESVWWCRNRHRHSSAHG